MGSVIMVYDIIPKQNDEAGANALLPAIQKIALTGEGSSAKDYSKMEKYYVKVGILEVKDFVFGTKKVSATFEIPDASGSQDALEAVLQAIDGVDSVVFVDAGRPI